MAKRNEQETVAAATVAEGQTTQEVRASSPYQEMLKQAAKVQSAYRTGGSVTIPDKVVVSSSEGLGARQQDYTVPGVMVYNWYPTAGVASSATDPVNMAIKSIYAFVRSANSGARNYQPSDLYIYTTALDSIYSLYYQIARVVGLLNVFSERNVYYPKALVEALGFDYDDFVDNQPNIIFTMANWKAKMRQFSLPASMRVYQDHRDMNTTIYTDGDTVRAQMFAFVQDGFWTYEVVDQVKGLTLRRIIEFEGENSIFIDQSDESLTRYHATWSATKALFNTMLEAFLTSDDVALISGDIEKAYREAGFVDLPLLDSTYVTPIGKSDIMLTAIMNANVIPIDPATCRVQDVASGEGYVVSQPGFNSYNYYSRLRDATLNYAATEEANLADNPYYFLISNAAEVPAFVGNTYWENQVPDDPTDDDLIAALRFRVWLDESTFANVNWPLTLTASDQEKWAAFIALQGTNPQGFIVPSGYDFKLQHCGTEVIHSAYMYTLAPKVDYAIASDDSSVSTYANYMPEFLPVTRRYYSMTRTSATEVSVASSTEANVTRSLVALSHLANFDWHHRVYPESTQMLGGQLGKHVILPPIIDTQNVIPLGRQNIQQFVDAALYVAFFG